MRTSSPEPPGQTDAAPWRRWLLPAALAAGLVTLLALPRGEFGLSEAIGPVSYSGPPAGYLSPSASRGYSEHTQWLVDQEVAALLTKAETRARNLLTNHREALAQLTAALLEQETVTGDQVRALAWPTMTTASEPSSSTKRISR